VRRTRALLVVAIGSGGALGALARYSVELAGDVGPSGLPWPTLSVNVSGAFVLGLAVAVLGDRARPTPYLRAFVTIGLLGGYTTFSTWTVETVVLVRHHAVWTAVVYTLLTVVVGIAAVYLGGAAGRALPAGGGERHEARRHR
jgi:CrcB protein